MEESEWSEANQKAMVGEDDREANQKEEPSGKSWGFPWLNSFVVAAMSHMTILGDDRGNGDLVGSVFVHDVKDGILFSSVSI